mmetsp:Transcript_12506/g.28742  ORF Transcript_12506/g.28742 Transcript_12506/m.28742 type:complete len:81 (-) Transcript_12506:80-322(-)
MSNHLGSIRPSSKPNNSGRLDRIVESLSCTLIRSMSTCLEFQQCALSQVTSQRAARDQKVPRGINSMYPASWWPKDVVLA